MQKNHDIISKTLFQFQHYILGWKRNYALDLTPGMLHANGEAVNEFIKSSVSDYCEFKKSFAIRFFYRKDSSKKSKEQVLHVVVKPNHLVVMGINTNCIMFHVPNEINFKQN